MAEEENEDETILEEALEAFAECEEAEQDQRGAELEDLKFARLGEQWPDSVKRQRELDGRPCLTINKLPAFIRQVVNDSRQNKPQIKVLPVDDSADRETADIMSDLIRNIENISSADTAYDTGIDNAATMGRGYWRVVIDYACDDTFDMDILIKRISNPFTVYGDPMSTEADGSDWNVAFVTDVMKRDDFLKKYPNSEIKDWSYDGKDEKLLQWITDDSVRIAEYWTREEVDGKLLLLSNGQLITEDQLLENKDLFDSSGITVSQSRPTKTYKVMQYILNGAEILETNPWPGRYIPIIPVYGEEINVEGKRQFHSLIRQAKDAQRMFNYWRTTSTELVALAPRVPYIGQQGSFVDADKWSTANSVSHAYLEYKGAVPPQRQSMDSGPAAGALQEALNASDDIKSIVGMYDASLGARSNETSGVAISARQREGDTSTFHFIDNLTRAIRFTGRILIDLIPHVYNKARVVRVIGEDGSTKTAPVNQPIQVTDQNGQPVMNGPDPVTKIYDLTSGKYDLVVNSGPSFTTRRQEAAAQMTELFRSFPAAAPLLGDILAKNLDWPGADEIEKRLSELRQQQSGNPQNAQQMQQAQAAIAQLSKELNDAQMSLKNKDSENQTKLIIAQMGAEVDKLGLQLKAQENVLKNKELDLKHLEIMKKPDTLSLS